MITPILLIVFITFLFYPLYIGYRRALYVDFILEVKVFSSPYYTFGVHFIEHSTEDPDYIEQEFTIALFLFSVTLVFYKHIDDA